MSWTNLSTDRTEKSVKSFELMRKTVWFLLFSLDLSPFCVQRSAHTHTRTSFVEIGQFYSVSVSGDVITFGFVKVTHNLKCQDGSAFKFCPIHLQGMGRRNRFLVPHEFSAIKFEACCMFIVTGYALIQAVTTVFCLDSLTFFCISQDLSSVKKDLFKMSQCICLTLFSP